MTLPYQIADGDDFSAAPLMANLNDLDGRFPVADANIASGITASKLSFPAGYQIPTSAVPNTVFSDVTPASMTYLSSDPQFVRAYGLQFTRRMPVSSWTAPTGGGFVAPIKDGVVMCARTANVVYEIPRNSAGGGSNLFILQRTHTFTAGDQPVHAVPRDAAVVYVLCQGNSPTSNPSIKTITVGGSGGAASSWLDLGASYTSVRKLCINRDGSYLYVLAKKSGDSNHRRVLRVDTATKAVSECDTGFDYDTHDLCVVYNTNSGSNGTGEVFVGQSRQTSLGGTVWRVRESTSGIYGGSFPSTVDGTAAYGAASGSFPSTPSSVLLYQMIPFRGGVVAVLHSGTVLYARWVSYVSSPSATGRLYSSEASLTTATLPIAGAGWTDGTTVYIPQTSGAIAFYDVSRDTGLYSAPQLLADGTAAAGTYTDPSGGAFTGRSNIGYMRKASDGTGYMFSF